MFERRWFTAGLWALCAAAQACSSETPAAADAASATDVQAAADVQGNDASKADVARTDAPTPADAPVADAFVATDAVVADAVVATDAVVADAVVAADVTTALDATVATDGSSPRDGAVPGDTASTGDAATGTGAHEVWLVDQSDTAEESGGLLFVYRGSDLETGNLAGVTPERIDLGMATRTLCVERTRSAPRRPHMLLFSPDERYAVLSFVATGHVVFFDAATRTPVQCIDVGVQAHAAVPTADGRHVVVANQNGKLLQRITSDWARGTFTLDESATLNLASCTTPSGAPCEGVDVRPDNAPICPIVDEDSRMTFVTLRGGGMLVVDHTQSPMRIVAEYDRSTVAPNGCGGVQLRRRMFINSGGGTAATPLRSTLYAFELDAFTPTPNPVNRPAPRTVFDFGTMGDNHGAVLHPNGRFLWTADRARNLFDVVDTNSLTRVGEIRLEGSVSADPAPDLLDISPDGRRVYASLRGATPLTANAPGVNNAVGATPGLAVIDVSEDGRNGVLRAIARVSNRVGDVERSDPHGLRVRRLR